MPGKGSSNKFILRSVSGSFMKTRYVPNLAKIGAICEANYVRLQKLMPALRAGQSAEYELFAQGKHLGTVRLQVVESAKYTQTLYLEQVQAAGRWLNNPEMTVRVYHDARMAEVVSCFQHRQVRGHNEYPNDQMHLPDEKLQLNSFLADWLNYC